MSLPINGTDGKWIDVEGTQVRLEKGFYEVTVDFVKPGLEMGRIKFTTART